MKNIVHAKKISVDEARQVSQELLQRLRELSQEVNKGLRDLIGKISNTEKKKLEKIQDIVKSLKEEVEKAYVENLNTSDLEKGLKTIIKLFEGIDGDDGFMASLVTIETNVVIAQLKIKLIADMKFILEDPEKALPYIGVSFYRKREIMAERFQVCIPKFFGYRVKVRSDPGVMIIRLTGEPPIQKELTLSPTKALKPEVEEFVIWELRKWGYTMKYDINAYDDGPNKLVTCKIKLVTPDRKDT